MWVTGVSYTERFFPVLRTRGFTLIELMAALAIAALVLAVAVPATVRVYDSMRYREAVRDVVALFASARYKAITTGRAQNLEVVPVKRTLTLAGDDTYLPSNMRLAVHGSKELNRDGVGVIRFYPEGGTSGGGVDIETRQGKGVSIKVDWLMGGITQETYAIQ